MKTGHSSFSGEANDYWRATGGKTKFGRCGFAQGRAQGPMVPVENIRFRPRLASIRAAHEGNSAGVILCGFGAKEFPVNADCPGFK